MATETRPDYDRLLDAETRAFIQACESHYPPEAATHTIAEQRAAYDRLCQTFDRPYPDGVEGRDRVFGGVPCRHYRTDARAKGPVTLYFHGGGFILGGLESHDAICAEICAATGRDVVSVDYRLAPEHRHPAQIDDARTAARTALAEFGRPLVLAGDSAGGTLAAALAHDQRGSDAEIAGQVLIYPLLGRDRGLESYTLHADAPLLTTSDVLFYDGVRFEEDEDAAGDASAWPLDGTDYTGLPPTVTVIAGCDPLADDGRLYTARIRAAGGDARLIEEPHLVHGYLRARHSVARARASFARITSAIAGFA